MILYLSALNDPDVWFEESPGSFGYIYFPKAEWLLTHCPWIAVRLFWLVIAFRDGLDMYWGREVVR
ncbi:hypothetical protein LCGC14_0542370 [marine sediment metagenome]|uniref:Uncharacterized protein n=1 Tax=marine sediment metagenome TaxID=412755 RepID=A0A0F9SAW8_9ZZZZ